MIQTTDYTPVIVTVVIVLIITALTFTVIAVCLRLHWRVLKHPELSIGYDRDKLREDVIMYHYCNLGETDDDYKYG